MKYYVTLHGQEFEVELDRQADGRLTARLGDREEVLDLATIQSSRRYSVLAGRRSHDVVVEPTSDGLQMLIGGHRLDARVEDERQRSARRIAAHAPRGPVTVESTMPGVLREIRVQVGDRVAGGQALVILEAMKMENEIASEQAGVVREVLVEEGAAVEGGTPLVVLDPPPGADAAD